MITNGKQQQPEPSKQKEGKDWENPVNPEGAEDQREKEQIERQKEEAERRNENLTDKEI
ncbi:MAG: hypothetical protein ABI390_10785 [Daejeonella sp.]